MKISKEVFFIALEGLKEQSELDFTNSELLEKVFPHSSMVMYPNDAVKAALLFVLKDLTNDNSGWINYFIDELDYGKNYKEGCAVEKDGTIIPLATPLDLYDLLEKNEKVSH